jgi:anti-anti-sigma factor
MTDFAQFDVTNTPGDQFGSGRVSTVTVAGEIDLSSAPRLRHVLMQVLDAGEVDAVVDLSAVEFVDASGIGVLVWAAHQADDRGGRLTLRQPSRAVRDVLDLLELDGALPIES